MSTAIHSSPGETASRRILLGQAGLDLYRENAFRVTGLAVDASTKEIARHADKLKIMEELGQRDAAPPSAFPLNPPSSVDQIRDAIRRLRDPEKRLINEFFWFWPLTVANSVSDPGIQALTRGDPAKAFAIWKEGEGSPETGFIATHNIAVMCHLMAVEWTLYQAAGTVDSAQGNEILTYWSEALTRWRKIARSDQFWDAVRARIRSIDDFRLTTGFEREIRESLLDVLSTINAEAALEFAEQQRLDLASSHLRLARETQQDPDKFARIAQQVLASALTLLKQQIESARQRTRTHASEALIASHELLKQAHHTLSLVTLFFGEASEVHHELSDEIANVCNQLQVSYHNTTGDHEACIATLQTILPLATSPELRQQIDKNIRTLSGLLQQKELEPIYTVLKAIQDSTERPSTRLGRFQRQIIAALPDIRSRIGGLEAYTEFCDAMAIVLRGISLAAWNEYQDRTTAVSANALALKHVRDSSIRQHLTNDKKILTQIGVKRLGNALAPLGCLVPIAVIGLLAGIGSFNSNRSSPSDTSKSGTYSPNYSQNGTYRIPSYRTAEVNRDSQAVEAAKTQLQRLDWQLKSLREEIEQDRLFLDNASQDRINAFNTKVDHYNSLLQEARSQGQAVDQMVDDYNAKLRRYSQ
jgi:hypothetical protein